MLRGRHATPHHATIVRGSWKRRRMQKHDTARHGMASKPSRKRRRRINGLYAHCRTHCCVQYQRCLGLVVKRRISSLAPSSPRPPLSDAACDALHLLSPLRYSIPPTCVLQQSKEEEEDSQRGDRRTVYNNVLASALTHTHTDSYQHTQHTKAKKKKKKKKRRRRKGRRTLLLLLFIIIFAAPATASWVGPSKFVFHENQLISIQHQHHHPPPPLSVCLPVAYVYTSSTP